MRPGVARHEADREESLAERTDRVLDHAAVDHDLQLTLARLRYVDCTGATTQQRCRLRPWITG